MNSFYMKNIFILATFLSLITVGLSATSRGFYGDPEHPGKCIIRPDLIYSAGSHRDGKDCTQIVCSENGYAHIYSCGIQLAGPGCSLGNYLEPDADYPACCNRKTICV